MEGEKPENLEKKPLSKARTNNKLIQPTYGTRPELVGGRDENGRMVHPDTLTLTLTLLEVNLL